LGQKFPATGKAVTMPIASEEASFVLSENIFSPIQFHHFQNIQQILLHLFHLSINNQNFRVSKKCPIW
jgi:hypothetical protein